MGQVQKVRRVESPGRLAKDNCSLGPSPQGDLFSPIMWFGPLELFSLEITGGLSYISAPGPEMQQNQINNAKTELKTSFIE